MSPNTYQDPWETCVLPYEIDCSPDNSSPYGAAEKIKKTVLNAILIIGVQVVIRSVRLYAILAILIQGSV